MIVSVVFAAAPAVKASQPASVSYPPVVSPSALTAGALSVTESNTSQTPKYAFNGASAVYQVTLLYSNGTDISGTVSYTISDVDTNAQTFNVTVTYGGQLATYYSPDSGTFQASFPNPSPFGALSPSDLQLANSGVSPIDLQGTVTTGVSVTVPAGTFITDAINTTSAIFNVDQNSGLFIKAAATPSGLFGGLTSDTVELQSTNIPTSVSPGLPILLIAGIIIVIVIAAGVGLFFYQRSRQKSSAVSTSETVAPPHPDTPPPSPPPSPAQE